MEGEVKAGDRRIYRNSLLKFIEERGMQFALSAIIPGRSPILALGCHIDGAMFTNCQFEFGRLFEQHKPDVVVIDASIGRADALRIARNIRCTAKVYLVGIVAEDELHSFEWLGAGYNTTFKQPVDTDALMRELWSQRTDAVVA
jgi:hypothetical protein